jgi:hypothetical protein
MNKDKNIKKLPKRILIIHPDLNTLNNYTEQIIDSIIPRNQRSLFLMELNFENCIKLIDLRISVNDFIKNRSIFSTYPKILLVRNIDLTNQSIRHIYSKIISINHNVIMITSSLNISNVPSQVVAQSDIYWCKNKKSPITEKDFYKWINNRYQYSTNISKKDILYYLNNNWLSNIKNDNENFEKINNFNIITETHSTNFHDECIKLILKTSNLVT